MRKSRKNQAGVALVIILAFIVLLVILVLAYFSFSALHRQVSTASSGQALTAIFAEGAINTTIGDLRQEIIDGSTNFATNGNPLYFPLNPVNAAPARAGTSANLPNLVKRSAYNQAFYSFTNNVNGPSRAADSSTTNASHNGRVFPASRWNASLLLPKADTNSFIDFTPVSSFAAPDWIYVARDGSNPTNWNPDMTWSRTNAATVVGRYAYAIYDEGGLLDMNAAGYPPGSSTNLIAQKGVLAAADLSVIPGLGTNAINALVGWRNYVTAEANGSFPNYSFSGSGANYFKAMRGSTSGFLRTANTNLSAGQSDRMFVSRQQLIQFLTQGVAANDAERAALQNALQYLGTFSRDLEQPSFRPDPDRPKNTSHDWATSGTTTRKFGGNDAYDPSKARQDQINPALLSVRDAADDPVLKRRFPLSRLALLEPDPPEENQQKILDYFGLTWNSTTKSWDYDHGSPNQIYKLSEIPAGREPDFFEILKATINCESIAKQYGGTEGVAGGNYSPHLYTNGAAAIDGVVNFQLIQIGANIIDQYDSNSYPTSIKFGGAGRFFRGVENLPYLSGWILSWYRMKKLTASDIATDKQPPLSSGGTPVFPYETWVMLQPILWNPHAPDPNLDTTQVPTKFRVTASSVTDGGVTVNPLVRPTWWSGSSSQAATNYPTISGPRPSTWSQASLHPTTSILTFNATPNSNSGTAAPSSFTEPYRLLYNFPPGSNADADPGYAAGKFSLDAFGSVADPVLATHDATHDGKTIIGFFNGKAWTGPSEAMANVSGTNSSLPPNCLSSGYISDNLQLKLEYQDSSGEWRTYDVINQVYASSVNAISTVDNKDAGNEVRAFSTNFRSDPRTDRWGLFYVRTFPLAPSPTGVTSAGNNGIHPESVSWIYPLPQGTTLSPRAGENSGFVYRLFRNASGHPLVEWSTAAFLSDLSVNLNTGSSASYVPGRKFYYNDPDHVIRRASGATFSGKEGLPMNTANYPSRPVILNRPFRSVAELGYAFSDTPWKDINFFMPESGDAALLDAFCLNEVENAPAIPVVAGRVNLNTRQPSVLKAIINGVSKAEGGVLTEAEAQKAADALVKWTTDVALNKGPLRNRSELVGKFVSAVDYIPPPSSNDPNLGIDGALSYSGYSSLLTSGTGGVFATAADGAIKRRRESVMRALVDPGNVRTWNLLIDMVAQTGRFPQHASALNDFTVEGETRYWVHLAIDRFTGEVIAREVETVSE